MDEWNKAIYALAKIIENPEAKKGYKDLINYYKLISKDDYAKGIEYLMEKRFGTENAPSSEKQ